MRGHCVCLVAILTIAPSTVWSASDGIPTLDVRPVCRGIAGQSADPGVGQRNQTETFQQCMESEQAVREQLKQEWSAFSAADKRHLRYAGHDRRGVEQHGTPHLPGNGS